MNDLPKSWVVTTLNDVARWSSGGTPRSTVAEYYGGTIPWVVTGDLTEGTVSTTAASLSEAGLANSSAKMVPTNTVLIAMYGASIGRLGLAGCALTTNQAIATAQVIPDVLLPKYLFYYLMGLRPQLVAAGKGAAQPNIGQAVLKAWRIPVAPFAEQERIVAAIEEQFSQVDVGVAALERARLSLKRMRAAAFVWTCMGQLTAYWRDATSCEPIEKTIARLSFEQSSTGRRATGDIIRGRCILSVGKPDAPAPDGWQWTPLSAVARLESGHTPSRRHQEYWDGPVPWIGIQDAREHHGGRIVQTRQHVSELGIQNSSARLLPVGTVCLSRTASVGYAVIMGASMATSQDFVNWICSEALVPEFLMYAIMAEGEAIKRFGRGTTHTTIYYPEVKALHICLPPVEEQREIVQRVERCKSLIESLEAALVAATHRSDSLRSSILASAFSGELVSQDTADEPASVLLERISAKRSASHGRGSKTTQARGEATA